MGRRIAAVLKINQIRFSMHESGQSLTEYALIILLVAIALVGAVTGFGTNLSGLYNTIVAGFP